jgi:hypothetical protein
MQLTTVVSFCFVYVRSCFSGKYFEIACSRQHEYLFRLVVVQRFRPYGRGNPEQTRD